MAIKNVMLAGVNDNLGSSIAKALHQADYNVSALIRSDPPAWFPSYIRAVHTDYTQESLNMCVKDMDAVVSMLPVTAVDAQLALIDAAVQAKVQRFVPSEFGWDPSKPILAPIKERLAGKAQVMDRLQQVCTGQSPDMTWTAMITGVFMDWSLTKVPSLGFRLSEKKARIVDSGNEMVTGSTAADMGVALANLLSDGHNEETANRWVRIRSVQFSQNQLLEALKKVTDASWSVEQVTTEEVEASREQHIAEKRFPQAFMDTLAVQLFEEDAGRGMVVKKEGCDNALLGIEERSILTVVKELID